MAVFDGMYKRFTKGYLKMPGIAKKILAISFILKAGYLTNKI
jgi:hypothetical protein